MPPPATTGGEMPRGPLDRIQGASAVPTRQAGDEGLGYRQVQEEIAASMIASPLSSGLTNDSRKNCTSFSAVW